MEELRSSKRFMKIMFYLIKYNFKLKKLLYYKELYGESFNLHEYLKYEKSESVLVLFLAAL